MPQYKYVAKELSGKTQKGIVEAKDKDTAIGVLRKRNLVIITLEEGGAKSAQTPAFLKKSIQADDLVVFSRQLATMIESGIPLVNCLDILYDQMDNLELKGVVKSARDDIESGASFSEAISKHPKVFSPFFVNMSKAGESSGALDEILDRIATYLEKTSNLQKKIKSALIYPAVVVGMSLLVTIILIVKVIPVFKDIYSGFGAKLPLPTQILISVSDFMRAYFVIMVIAISGILFLLHKYVMTKKGKLHADSIQLKLPIFGILLKKVSISKFTRTFSTLIRSGVPILTALDIVGKTSGNVVIENAVENVKTNVRDGENISDPLARSGVFPPMVYRMISVGEKSGELEKMLIKISDFYDAQVDATVSGLTSLIEPLIIAFLGIVIGGIVICMFLPIFKMSQLVGF